MKRVKIYGISLFDAVMQQAARDRRAKRQTRDLIRRRKLGWR